MKPVRNQEYVTPATPAEVASRCQCSVSLVRLAIDCGLPCPDGRLAPADFAEWMANHYNLVRQKSGLPLLNGDFGLGLEDREQLKIRNTLRTYADYLASRTTCTVLKEKAMQASNRMANCRFEDL